MTRVTDFSVRDFKAVEEAEVQPGGVNLVVGRNNVGKTSLLEGLHLALDPRSISRFDGNLDKVVREGAETATVDVTVRGSDGTDDRSVTVERQDEKAAYEAFATEVRNKLNEVSDTVVETDATETVLSASHKVASYLRNGEHTPNPRRHSALLRTDSKVNYRSSDYDRRVELVASDLLAQEETKIHETVELGGSRMIPVSSSWRDRLGEFEQDTPAPLTITRLTTDSGITDNTPDPNADGNAIRRSRIEDFLIDNAILDGLVDFSFDRLVFEDGGEREEIPYEFMGSGFKTLVGILWELYDQDNDTEVMIVEEPAVHMHPGYVNEFTQQLLQVARQEAVQLFVTTHREDLIESFFAPPTERAHGDYLREEFRVIQMTELLTKQLDYEQAETELDELNTDLRGI